MRQDSTRALAVVAGLLMLSAAPAAGQREAIPVLAQAPLAPVRPEAPPPPPSPLQIQRRRMKNAGIALTAIGTLSLVGATLATGVSSRNCYVELPPEPDCWKKDPAPCDAWHRAAASANASQNACFATSAAWAKVNAVLLPLGATTTAVGVPLWVAGADPDRTSPIDPRLPIGIEGAVAGAFLSVSGALLAAGDDERFFGGMAFGGGALAVLSTITALTASRAPRRSDAMLGTGVVFTQLATTVFVTGLATTLLYTSDTGRDRGLFQFFLGVCPMIGSTIFAGIGIPLWIVGASAAKGAPPAPASAWALPAFSMGPGSANLRWTF